MCVRRAAKAGKITVKNERKTQRTVKEFAWNEEG